MRKDVDEIRFNNLTIKKSYLACVILIKLKKGVKIEID